jgi:tetratricopeptide (TPR) repeat protein
MDLKPTRKAFLIPVAVLLFVGLSYFSIRAALASYYTNQGTLQGYEKATRLEPTNPENWQRLGDAWQYDLQQADPQQAIRAYRTSLSLNPNAAQAWLGLAAVYEGQGELDAAREALLNAKRAYPISADVSWRYANFLARNGEPDLAFREAHEAVEKEPQRAWEAFSLFRRFDSDTNEVADRLLPPRESAYLDVIWGLDSDARPTDALKVWDRLFALDKKMPEHRVPTATYQLTQEILFALVDQLLSQGYASEARRVWDEALTFMHFPSRHDPRDSLVWDGGFETSIVGGLSWRIAAPSGSMARFSTSIKHSGTRSLEIKFDGRHNVAFGGACQFVVVEPDTSYDFSAWLRTESITTDRGVFLRLSTPQAGQPEIVTPELTGTHPWTRSEVRWRASKNAHLLQICLMRLPSYNLYNTIAGTVWMDDVQLVPVTITSSFGRSPVSRSASQRILHSL